MSGSPTATPYCTPAPCVFVIGCDRSGTTLLQNLLNAHPDLFVSYETSIVNVYERMFEPQGVAGVLENGVIDRMLQSPLEAAPLQDTPYPELIEAVYRQCCAEQGKRIWGDKTPTYTRQVQQLVEWFPDACFVHIVRDPRAVALSWTKTAWGPMTEYAAAKRWVKRVNEAATHVERYTRRSITIRFEDLVHEPEATLTDVCNAIGVEFDARMMDSALRSKSILKQRAQTLHWQHDQAPNQKTAEQWRQASNRVLTHVESVAHEEMARWGYEPVTRYKSKVGAGWQLLYGVVGRARRVWRRRITSSRHSRREARKS